LWADAVPFVQLLHIEAGMTTKLAIDNTLLERARRIGKLPTKKETVIQALTEFIERRRQREILKALGTIEFRRGWDYKKDRRLLSARLPTTHRRCRF
jgi:Arc/MetJ family transcription regulator